MKEVLLVGEGDNVKVGTPFVNGASVVAVVKEHGKGRKNKFQIQQKNLLQKTRTQTTIYSNYEIKSINA